MPPITPLEFLSIHPSSPFEIFHAPFRDANSLRARIIERVASSSEYLPAGSRYVFKITFLRVPPTCYYRQVSSAASAPTRGPITPQSALRRRRGRRRRLSTPASLSPAVALYFFDLPSPQRRKRGEPGWRSRNGGRKRERKDAVEAVSFIPI